MWLLVLSSYQTFLGHKYALEYSGLISVLFVNIIIGMYAYKALKEDQEEFKGKDVKIHATWEKTRTKREREKERDPHSSAQHDVKRIQKYTCMFVCIDRHCVYWLVRF